MEFCPLDLDDIVPVENFSDLMVQVLCDRLARSRTAEHSIYRESELDELWRLLDIAAKVGDPDALRDAAELGRMRDLVHRAHDLVGMDNKPLEAAAMLRLVLER
jgi:hypothetical protein